MTEPHTPLTYRQLDEIEARATAATPGPWQRYEEYGPRFFANTTGEYLRGVGDFNFGLGEQADADEAFVRHAQQDMTALLAYARRLQGQRKFLLTQLAKRDAASGEGDRALREFLTANPDEDEMAASMARDGFGPDEITDMLSRPAVPAVVETGEEAS